MVDDEVSNGVVVYGFRVVAKMGHDFRFSGGGHFNIKFDIRRCCGDEICSIGDGNIDGDCV